MKIIIFSIFIIFVTIVFFFQKTDKTKKNHTTNNQYHTNNKKLMGMINTLFIDSPEDDLFLYSRLITSMGENGIHSLAEYDFNVLKKNVEKVLEPYLNSKNLFSKSYFNESYFDKISRTSKKDEWTNFIRGTLVYVEYLDSIGKQKKANKILEKIFYDTQQRVLHSKIMIEYSSAIYDYNTLFIHMKSSKRNKLFKKYPLPDASIFFQKLVNEKEYNFYIYKMRFNFIIKEKYNQNTSIHSKEISKYRIQYFDKVKQYFTYYDKLAKAIKSESPEQIKSFYEEIEKEKSNLSEKSKKMLEIDNEKYIFLINLPMRYDQIYNLHKKLFNMVK